MFDEICSIYESATDAYGRFVDYDTGECIQQMSIREFCLTDRWKPYVQRLRAMRKEYGSKAKKMPEYIETKKKLPGATLSGLFSLYEDDSLTHPGQRVMVSRRETHLQQHTGWLAIDIDLDDNKQISNFDNVRNLAQFRPDTVVVVCEKRAEGIRRLRQEHPEVDLVVMDDGFQHRYVEPKVNIVMIDATRPVQHDRMLPAGNLRDLPEQLHRAHYFIVTKCPENMAPIDRRILRKVLVQVAYQRVYFTRFESFRPRPLFPEFVDEELNYGQQVIAMSGIGNPGPFVEGLRNNYKVIEDVRFDDHHVYRVKDMKLVANLLAKHPKAAIIMTEKDAVKMSHPEKIPAEVRKRMYFLPINISFIDDSETDFLQKLECDVREN